MKIQNINKITQSLGQIKKTISKVVELSGFNQSVYIEGPSGIGKSEIVAQLAKEMGAELIDIRLGNLDTIDLNGIGVPDIENQTAIWTRPEFFPKEGCEKKYIMFLDEFNHASEQVFGAAYQLVLERRMGTHKLPKNVLVIGAGNGIDDKGISFSMPSPLVNRFMKINAVPNVNDWLEYTNTIDIDWKITGFIKANEEYLHKFDGTSNEDNFSTPRNWVRLNDYVNHFEDEDFADVVLNGLLGFSTMIQFKQYMKIVSKLPHLEKILKGEIVPQTLTDLNSSYGYYMLVKNYLINNLKDTTEKELLNLFKYNNEQPNQEVMQLLNTEIITMINKNIPNDKKEKLQYLIFKEKEVFGKNKKFIEQFSNFSKEMKEK